MSICSKIKRERKREGRENSINFICLVRNCWIHMDELAKHCFFTFIITCIVAYLYRFIRCLYLFNHTILQHGFNLILTVSYNLNYRTIFYCLLAISARFWVKKNAGKTKKIQCNEIKNEGKSTLLRMSKTKFCGKIGSLTFFSIC